MGTRDGSIIATIIMVHMPRNEAAAPSHVCPRIRIHVIDMVQSPGIGIPRIADIDMHPTIVAAVLTMKSRAETLINARRDACSRVSVMGVVIALPPGDVIAAPSVPGTAFAG